MNNYLNNRVGNSIRNASIGIILQFIQMISTIICRVIFVKVLTSEYMGVNGLFSNIITILTLTQLGIGSAIGYELYVVLANDDEEAVTSLLNLYKKAYYVIGSIIFLLGLVVMPFLKLIISGEVHISENLYFIYFLFLLETTVTYFFSYKQSLISAAQQEYILTTIDVTCGVIRNILQCIILILWHNFYLYLTIQVVSRITYNIWMSNSADIMFPFIKSKNVSKIPQETQIRIWRNVRDIAISNVSVVLVKATDNIFITSLIGLAVTGINSNYVLISDTIATFTDKIHRGMIGGIGNVNAIETINKKISTLYEIYMLMYWIYFWSACSYSLLVQDTISIFFGKEYVLPFSIGVITAVNFMQYWLSNVIKTFWSTLGLFKHGRLTSFFTGIVNIFLSILLGRFYGLFGILFATFVSRLVTSEWYIPYAIYKYGFQVSVLPFYRRVLRGWLEAGIIFVITWGICSIVKVPGIVNLLYRFVICITIPNILIIFANRRRPEFISAKLKIIRSISLFISKYKIHQV